MSYYWTPFCESCGEEGPKIRSGHSGLKFGPDHETSSELLGSWLDGHEHHDVRLRGEGTISRAPGGDSGGSSRLILRAQDAASSAQSRLVIDDWDPVGVPGIRLDVGPGTRQIFYNNDADPVRLRPDAKNRFVFPDGVAELVVRQHSAAVFVGEKAPRWERLWCRLTRRPPPPLRWRWLPEPLEESSSEQERSP